MTPRILTPVLLSLCVGCASLGGEPPLPRATTPWAAPPPVSLAVAPPPPTPVREVPTPEPEPPSLELTRLVLAERAPKLSPLDREAVAIEVYAAESELGLPCLMVLALIEQESHFRPEAVGPRGSIGLMQLRPFVAEDVAKRHALPWHGKASLRDPRQNVRLGTLFLSELRERFGSMELALAAYNMGPSRVKRRMARGMNNEVAYVRRVMGRYHTLRREFGDTETGIGG